MERNETNTEKRPLACEPSILSGVAGSPVYFFYPLFEHMSREHGLTLLESEISEIVGVVAELIRPQMTEEYITALQTALIWCERDLATTPDDSGYAERVRYLCRALQENKITNSGSGSEMTLLKPLE